MDYTNKISSLEEMSRLQVAINLCQENSFKEVALLLEKPTYGILLTRVTQPAELYRASYNFEIFVSDPQKLSTYGNIRCHRPVDAFAESCCCSDTEKARLWDTAIEERCQNLMERIPGRLRQGVLMWMYRIALQYLSYSRRVELFGVSRYFLMDVLTWDVWTKAGRLDEEKLALRLLQCKELTVLQRYRIACTYCLHEYVHRLWRRLTQGEKEMICWAPQGDLCKETNDLVLWWSRRMPRSQEEGVRGLTNGPWIYAASKATFYGNRAAVMQCWERLTGNVKQEDILNLARLAAERWRWARKRPARGSYKEILVSNTSLHIESHAIEYFNLPFYYSELLCFFLSQLNEEYQLTFFKEAFKSCFTDRIVESFLDWPHRDFFLPTMNRLWGVIPPEIYGQCLLMLVYKYIGEDEYRENLFFDYGGLLGMLWKATPEEYKQYVLSEDNERDYLKELLSGLLEKSRIQDEDEALFKLLFRDLPEQRISEMLYSEMGERFCLQLVREERWSLGNRLLEACLPKEEIPGFRRWFLYSGSGFHFCAEEFQQDRLRLLNDVIDWCFDSEQDKEQFRCELISKLEHSKSWHILLFRGEFDKVDRMVDFLTSSEQKKKLYRLHFAYCACRDLVGKSEEYRIDLILEWCLGDEKESRNDLKKHILGCKRACPFYSCSYSKPARES